MNSNISTDLRALIKEKKDIILKKTCLGFSENNNFKRLLAILHTCRKSYLNKTEHKAILISKKDVENLISEANEKIASQFICDNFITHNHIIIDHQCNLTSFENKHFENTTEAKGIYNELSSEYCVFYINPKGIHYFVDGIDVGDTIFFTSEEYNAFSELKEVKDLLDVLDDYRSYLTIRDNYRKFFVLKYAAKSLHKHLVGDKATVDTAKKFADENCHLLNNSPEDIFREDLRLYLKRSLKANVLGKEMVMENFKRLDIYIYDDFGELYFIEVKWVGLSIHASGEKIGTEIDHSKINPAAINQAVDYIRELVERGEKLKLGYLAVFDARKEDLEDTVETFDESTLTPNLLPYYGRFRKLPDFRVKNLHPY